MQAAVAVAPSNLNALSALSTLRSPVSLSIDSSRRDSLRPVAPEKNLELPAPTSPRTRLTRKRAASLDLDGAIHPRIGDLALNSASTPIADPTREQVCLCQPDPKIPRPRNAFILYRQHYQAQVVAQHPGLANPEISKIIGEQWREQATEVKSEWKKLAEEEKQRHQRQYPGYRYQPRRAGKANGIRPVSSSSAEDPMRCPKCSGRYISTPSTPLTPFTPAFGTGNARSDRLLPPFTPSQTNEVEVPRYTPQMQNTRMDTPRMGPPQQQVHRRPQYPQGQQQLQTHHEMDEEMELLSPSQDQKRRRFNNEAQRYNNEPPRGYPSASPITYSAPQQFGRNVPPSPYRQQPLPGPGMLSRTGSMGPPPQQSPISQHPQHQYPTRSSTFDESLRLPPLQTQLQNSAPTTATAQRPETHSDSRDSQARSIEAMVMTIPYLNKIKVLTKISPPLPNPGPTSPARETRGVVIVIEGADADLLSETGTFISSHLSQDPSCAVKTWGTSPSRLTSISAPSAADTEMSDGTAVPRPLSPITEEKDAFVEYLHTISDWHTKSREMIKYITTTPPSPITLSPSPSAKILPIALVPTGFSLTTSDSFALSIPIEDSYAPVDHWQWMATLWRGIVGPDLTVYVSRVGREEMVKFGGVEIRGDCNSIVVRVPVGEGVDEKTRRRLGFEVLEFVRGVEGGFDRS